MDQVIQSESEVATVSFSADGNMLAGACRDAKVRLWDTQSGALKRTVPMEKGDASVTLPAASDLLAAVGTDGTLKVWDLQTGAVSRRLTGPTQRVRRLAFTPDRKLVAGSSHAPGGGSEELARLWDSAGKERFAVRAGVGGTSAMALSPDGATLVAASYDTNVRAFSTRDGELVRLIEELPVAIFAMAFSPDGKYLAAGGVDRTVYLFDAKTWKVSQKLTGQPEMISALAFSPDSRMLVTGGFSEFTVKNPVKGLVWDIASGKVMRSVDASQRVESVAFSPNAKLVAVANQQKTVNVWAVPATR